MKDKSSDVVLLNAKQLVLCSGEETERESQTDRQRDFLFV